MRMMMTILIYARNGKYRNMSVRSKEEKPQKKHTIFMKINAILFLLQHLSFIIPHMRNCISEHFVKIV